MDNDVEFQKLIKEAKPDNKENLISLYKEAVQQLEEDFNNVKTDTGRTIIADAIEEYNSKLSELLEN